MMDVASALQRLANYRTKNSRASREIFESGVIVFRNDALHKLGDDSWQFLESLALAAVDVGRVDVAEACLKHLSAKFPESPRVQCLEGILKEATEDPEVALAFYQRLLEADPSSLAVWKRQISVLRRLGRTETAVDELSKLVDTFYTDVEAWLELADLYISLYQYTSALQALSHVLLLAPQNPFYVLQAAETAYTAEDIPLAIRFFLMTIDMIGDDEVSPPPTGITFELSAARLETDPRLATSSVLRQLAREVIETAQASQHGAESQASLIWLRR
ncbi:TPR-like protein [Lactarius akahatsu]|uniref:ER membrane protein complex subunit 2 n=1 Tax=Lactarius akahatsu TaxID=416441 RepID=A0AAD4QAE1_9AGAM|nr:TPR-like protein [Lactarius akahatsu]